MPIPGSGYYNSNSFTFTLLYQLPLSIPSTASVTFLPIWLIHSPLAAALRIDNSMKKRTMNRCSHLRVHTSTVKKSAATKRIVTGTPKNWASSVPR